MSDLQEAIERHRQNIGASTTAKLVAYPSVGDYITDLSKVLEAASRWADLTDTEPVFAVKQLGDNGRFRFVVEVPGFGQYRIVRVEDE